ncbi:hypothetical protein WMY93_018317 [Mugilogobius chulae]|uniref:Condensin complex subunit 1 C-terminal domain-containing protein n=1 Tax=Mugilogobius chulae TaxID=88201 RepID=A0AAW0NJN9_9GOBI
MEFIPALRFLRLNEIPKTFDDPVEEELSAINPKDFKKLYQSLLALTQEEAKTEQSVWVMLQENSISVKRLVAVLSFFVFAGKSRNASVAQRVNALQAASVYLLLLGLPGSIANKAFHGDLLDTCADIWTHCWPQESGKKRKKEPSKCSQKKGKRAKPRGKDVDEEEEMEEEDEEDAAEHFSGRDLVEIRSAVVLLVESLLNLLRLFSLKDFPQNAKNCTQVFIKLLYFEPIIGEINFTEQSISQMKSIPEMAFHGLQLLYSPKHGDQEKSLLQIFHRLLYVILMMNHRSHSSSSKPTLLMVNQSVLAARSQAIHFVCHMVNELKESALPCVRILLQHICFQMVEKNEFRSHGAQAVAMLAALTSSSGYALFVKWLSNFSQHSKMAGRLFSVDVVMALLEQPERSPEGCDPDLVDYLPHKYLIQEVLFKRRMDVSSTVQGHAFTCLAQCLELRSMNATRAVQGLFTTIVSQSELHAQQTEGSLTSHQTHTYRTLPFRTVELSNTDSSDCEGKVNFEHLLRRMKQPNTNVRKSALQALVGLLKHNVVPSTWENLSVLAARCRDPAVSVKKKALQCVGELLSVKPGCSDMQKAWLEGVCSAVMDSESTVQEKALEALDEVILSQIKPFSEKGFLDMNQRLAWDLLHRLSHDCHKFSRYMSKAFDIWDKQNRYTQSFFKALISHTESPNAEGAWLLLSKVVTSTSKLPYETILDAWDKMMPNWNEVNTKTLCNVLCVIGDIASHLNPDTQDLIIRDLMSQLKTFSLSLDVISAAVEALVQYGRSEDVKLTQVKHLHTLGVASVNCPAKISKRTILLVESVLTTNSDTLADVQGDLPASLPLSQFRANSFSTKIRSHGVLALGKLCLQHDELVPKYLPVFARELEEGTEVSVRNNVVVIMCDLCMRYTNSVDYYIPNISARLQDKSATIRENTVIMLTNLLQYVRVLSAHVLLKKNPEMFSQHFIECIFYFNSYKQHKSYNKFPQSDIEKNSSTLKGAQNREKRFHIYRFLLEHCTDAQRFSILNKINQTVLGSELLSETFGVLSLKEIKLQAMKSSGATAGEEPEEENMAKAVLEAAQKKVVSQIHKKVFIEHTVPLIISLKHCLEQKRSSVLKDLMAYLKVAMQDYKNEVKEFFAGDEQLASELEFALNEAEEQRMMEMIENCSIQIVPKDTPTPQSAEAGSPARPRPVLSLRFATPQPPPPNRLSQLTLTNRYQRSLSSQVL